MQLAYIRGHITATAKHPSFDRCRLLLAQPVDSKDEPTGSPQVVLDPLGAGIHQKVILSSDGKWVGDFTKDKHSPGRWWVQGIVDPERSSSQ